MSSLRLTGLGSYCVVLPSLRVSCSLGRGQGCWRWKAMYAVPMSLGPGMSRPAFVGQAQRYACKTRLAGHCGSERNGAWWASHWAMILICVAVIYTMVMGAPHEAQGVHLACRVSVDVGVRDHEWPLLIAVVVCQDGMRVMR